MTHVATRLAHLQWDACLLPDMDEVPHAGLRSDTWIAAEGPNATWNLGGVNSSWHGQINGKRRWEGPRWIHPLLSFPPCFTPKCRFVLQSSWQVLCAWGTQVWSCLLYLQGSRWSRIMVTSTWLPMFLYPAFPSFSLPWVCTSQIKS